MKAVDERLEHSSKVRSCYGEYLSGDAVVIRPLEHGLFLAIVDVLGHGPEAHELTHVIEAYLARYGTSDVSGLMTRLHQHLKGTRGAVAGLCAIDAATGRINYAGIGNTVMRRFGKVRKPGSSRRTASWARTCARPCPRPSSWTRGT